jgi:hypothetical protein
MKYNVIMQSYRYKQHVELYFSELVKVARRGTDLRGRFDSYTTYITIDDFLVSWRELYD